MTADTRRSLGGAPRWFVVVLAAGLLLRLALLVGTRDTPLQIVDELQFARLAHSLAAGDGFSYEAGKPTSARPPLYPWFVSAVWRITGESAPWVRAVQIGISLLTVLALYRLGRRLYEPRIARLAAAMLWLYPSLVWYDFLLLSEVLFTLLLTLFALGFVELLACDRPPLALATGASLGLAALTRSILWPFPLIAAPLVYFSRHGSRGRRLRVTALLLLGYALVVVPWAIRNTRVQGVLTVVDTMGGWNLRLGNYEHTPLDRPWDAIKLDGESSWWHQQYVEHPDAGTWTEGETQRWALRKAVGFILEHPGLTLRRSVVKFADFWGLEREIIAALERRLYRPPVWFAVAASASIVAAYAATALLAVLGICHAPPPDRRAHLFLLLIVLLVCGLHSITFGHSRYHLTLVPILLIYAAAAVESRCWRRLREPSAASLAALGGAALLLAIWARELLGRDFDRIRGLLENLH